MNFNIRIFIQYNASQKILQIESLQGLNSIISHAFSKFGLDEDPRTYSLILHSGKKKYFIVENGEELQNNDHALLMPKIEATKLVKTQTLVYLSIQICIP